jgi:hypothetical protein
MNNLQKKIAGKLKNNLPLYHLEIIFPKKIAGFLIEIYKEE